jgi:hypothetical protein
MKMEQQQTEINIYDIRCKLNNMNRAGWVEKCLVVQNRVVKWGTQCILNENMNMQWSLLDAHSRIIIQCTHLIHLRRKVPLVGDRASRQRSFWPSSIFWPTRWT